VEGPACVSRRFAEAFRGTNVRGRVIGSALFGEDDYAASLPERAARLGIVNQIDFRGFRADVWKELAGSTLSSIAR
jgi:hypothetical protein